MKKTLSLFSIISVLFFFSAGSVFATTWSNTGNNGYSNSTSPNTFSFACGAGDLIVVGVNDNAHSSDVVTGITYAGKALTEAIAFAAPGSTFDSLWYATGITTGTNNIVITSSASLAGTRTVASCFSGAKQGSAPDTTATGASSGTQRTVTLTTSLDNELIVGMAFDDNGTLTTAGANTQVLTFASTNQTAMIASSPLASTPAGNHSLVINDSVNVGNLGIIMAAFKIATAATTPTSFVFWDWF